MEDKRLKGCVARQRRDKQFLRTSRDDAMVIECAYVAFHGMPVDLLADPRHGNELQHVFNRNETNVSLSLGLNSQHAPESIAHKEAKEK
ncbi:hypothetical protein AB0E44_11025 [Micrococcus terreus]|uniref:hypothetical protein n=1 Tax=Micrococcus terreus TaxID=574650 RepID=UPI00340E5C64